jgi:hypothetical protein
MPLVRCRVFLRRKNTRADNQKEPKKNERIVARLFLNGDMSIVLSSSVVGVPWSSQVGVVAEC